ncbi:MAG: HAD-IIA family hydrolase [Candidatus Hydrogenedentes bacterium]|nr:HAD-IIA family hydrolase [Candidatus Hydrogenedentota bacterium]
MAAPKNYLVDMDGVLVRGRTVIPGAQEFVQRLKARDAKFLVLTNNPMYVPADLSHRLRIIGLDIGAENIFTSALATAMFLKTQGGPRTAFVIGESGLTSALHDAGFVITDHKPQYVVLGETQSYNLEMVTKAVRLVAAGAKFIATNPDASGPAEGGIVPACGAMAALIESATGRSAFFIGKPNPLMMRTALNYIDAHSEQTVMVGDRMDTDIVAGVQAGMETILVLTGVTRREDLYWWPYQPTHVIESVAQIEV